MTKPIVELVITDLDNTLYDWVSYFAQSFAAMMDEASRLLEVAPELLLDDLRAVHQRYGTMERPFALLDTDIVRKRFPSLSRRERAAALTEAFRAFDRMRMRTLQLYPGVRETLEILSRECLVVAHTESSVFNANFRLDVLGLGETFQRIYAAADGEFEHPYPEQIAAVSASRARSQILDPAERKPDPRIVLKICAAYAIEPSRCVYVGDSRQRDVVMAKQASAHAVWARYGTDFDPGHWAQLIRVTHWTEQDHRRDEEARRELLRLEPDVVIDRFPALLDEFRFTRRAE
jgi:phosphoglycolate phosphatase